MELNRFNYIALLEEIKVSQPKELRELGKEIMSDEITYSESGVHILYALAAYKAASDRLHRISKYSMISRSTMRYNLLISMPEKFTSFMESERITFDDLRIKTATNPVYWQLKRPSELLNLQKALKHIGKLPSFIHIEYYPSLKITGIEYSPKLHLCRILAEEILGNDCFLLEDLVEQDLSTISENEIEALNRLESAIHKLKEKL